MSKESSPPDSSDLLVLLGLVVIAALVGTAAEFCNKHCELLNPHHFTSKPVDIPDLLDAASEHARAWMDIWFLFVGVVTALLGALIALKRSLTNSYAFLLMIGFVIFSIMHGVTIFRHYMVLEQMYAMLDVFDDKGTAIKALLKPMGPVRISIVIAAYTLCVELMLWAIKAQAEKLKSDGDR